MRIAVNRGLQQLRNRRAVESIDSVGGEEVLRPRNVQPWQENPEQIYSRAETRELVEREVMKLPIPYRIAVMLRDIQKLSTEEAADAAGLTVPGLKTRLLRGRLMLREALAPHFSRREARGAVLNCREFLTEFGDYLDGLLTEEVHQELEAHLSQCRTCQVIHDSTRKTLRLVGNSGSFELPAPAADSLVTKIMDRIRSGEAPESEPKSEDSSR